MLQSLLEQALTSKYISYSARIADQELRGRKVAMFRDYYDGDHAANLTAQMRKLLRATREGAEFTDNHCRRIVNARSDRAIVKRIDSDDDALTEWVEELLEYNRFDALQSDVHEAAFRDADTYVLVSYDNAEQRSTFTHEPAYDGRGGVVAVYRSENDPTMDFAVKVWTVANENGATVDTVRVNVYFPDRIEKYIGLMGATLEKYTDPTDPVQAWPIPWVDEYGEPLGIPVFHFRNQGRSNYGLSVLEDAVPIQDAINRVLSSLVMATELTAFQILVVLGFDPPASISPGMFLIGGKDGIDQGKIVDVKALPAGDLTQILASHKRLKEEIHDVTNTPMPDTVSADASGESRKQHEVYLLGEVRRFQVKAGEAWERVVEMAYKLARLYQMPDVPQVSDEPSFRTIWASAEVRNQKEEVESALALRDLVGDQEVLRMLSHIYNWDEVHIEKIIAEKSAEAQQRIKQAMTATGKFVEDNPAAGADSSTPNTQPGNQSSGNPIMQALADKQKGMKTNNG